MPPRAKRQRGRISGTQPASDTSEFEKRWPTRRGHYEIETQCSQCHWWFDSFDPGADKCCKCVYPLPIGETGEPNPLAPMPPIQQNEVPPAASNPSPWPGTFVEDMPLDPALTPSDQTYGQGFEVIPTAPYFTGTISSPPGGDMPAQMWGQDYSISPCLPYCAEPTIPSFVEAYTQNQTYEQGYNMSLNSFYYPMTPPKPSKMYTLDQTMVQECDTPSHLSLYPGSSLNSLPTRRKNRTFSPPSVLRKLLPRLPLQDELSSNFALSDKHVSGGTSLEWLGPPRRRSHQERKKPRNRSPKPNTSAAKKK
ncbi:hypothetical protein F5Y12DRAFT_326545 [Xylaria sp. FL1777]|nr:hypothetical protein F5Y12DRAFT_326545 [Xylaria sp. FL1777]